MESINGLHGSWQSMAAAVAVLLGFAFLTGDLLMHHKLHSNPATGKFFLLWFMFFGPLAAVAIFGLPKPVAGVLGILQVVGYLAALLSALKLGSMRAKCGVRIEAMEGT